MFQVLSCDLVGKAMLALVSALLIRYMTEADYALYSVAYALMLVFIQMCSGALCRVYVIGFDRFQLKNDPSVLARLQLALLCLGTPILIAMIGVGKPIAWVCASAMILGCGAELVKSRFQQQMSFGKYSSVEFARSAVICTGVAAIVWFSGFHPAAMAVLSIQILSYTIVFFINGAPPLRVFQEGAWRKTAELGRALWRGPYRYLFLYFLVLAVFNQIDILVLRWAGTQHQLAAYSAAYRYYNVLLLALTAANAVLLPAAQRVRNSSQAADLQKQHRSALFLFVPVVLVAIAGAGLVMPAVDGGRYPESPAVFRVMAISSLLSFALSPALNLVLGAEDFRFLVIAALVGCALGPLLNLLLIPRYGAVGTAWSLLFSMAALNGAGFWRCSRYRLGGQLAVAA